MSVKLPLVNIILIGYSIIKYKYFYIYYNFEVIGGKVEKASFFQLANLYG